MHILMRFGTDVEDPLVKVNLVVNTSPALSGSTLTSFFFTHKKAEWDRIHLFPPRDIQMYIFNIVSPKIWDLMKKEKKQKNSCLRKFVVEKKFK